MILFTFNAHIAHIVMHKKVKNFHVTFLYIFINNNLI